MKADRASTTARLIAAATVMRGEQRCNAESLGSAAAWCRLFLSTSRGDRLLAWSVRHRAGRAWWGMVERTIAPGIVSHWVRRKMEIERLVRGAADEGFAQFVVIGAGLDSLAFRMSDEAKFERVLATDHPATLGTIRAAVSGVPRGGASVGGGAVELIPLDLTRDDPAVTISGSAKFDPASATVVLVEGVLMYLPESDVGRLLASLNRLGAARMRLIASWMVSKRGAPIGFHGQGGFVRRWLKLRHEPMLWGSEPTALCTWLGVLGWQEPKFIDLLERQGAEDAWPVGLADEQLLVVDGGVKRACVTF